MWLEPIPSHWVVTKFGYTKSVLTDYTANGSFADLKKNVTYLSEAEGYARLVRLTDLRKNLQNSDGVWISDKAYKYLSKSSLYGGEFLLANVGAYAGLFYQMPDTDVPASLAPNMFMAKFDGSKVCSRYIAYIGQSYSVHSQLRLMARASSAQPKLNKDNFKSVAHPQPSIDEQQRIANFLDHETAKIDTLIEKQQQLIKLLKEKRQAVISHAVTKGLNPDAPMKDSGIEWLAEVPAHWVIKPLRHVGQCQNGINIGAGYFGKGFPFISYGDVYNNKALPENGSGLVQSSKTDRVVYSVESGDVFFTRTSETVDEIGFSSVCHHSIPDAVFAGFLIRFRPFLKQLDVGFSTYFFQNFSLRSFFVKEMNLVTRASLSQDLLKKMTVLLPGIEEQKEISQYLDNKCSVIDQLVAKTLESIDLTKERRVALISAAVTGKIDVRNWQPETQLAQASIS